jgi:hypothetical protein
MAEAKVAEEKALEFSKAISLLIATAWADDDFMEALTEGGAKLQNALKVRHLKLPPIPVGPHAKPAKLTFVANTAEHRYIVIPTKPELSDDDVSLFVKLRQLDTRCTDCTGSKLAPIINDIKKVFGL